MPRKPVARARARRTRRAIIGYHYHQETGCDLEPHLNQAESMQNRRRVHAFCCSGAMIGRNGRTQTVPNIFISARDSNHKSRCNLNHKYAPQGVETSDDAALPAIVGPLLAHNLAYQHSAQVAAWRRLDHEACRRDRQRRDGGAGRRRLRRRAREGAIGRLFECGHGILTVGPELVRFLIRSHVLPSSRPVQRISTYGRP